MHLDKTADEGQTDSETTLYAVIGSVDLREHVEHRLELRGWNSDAVIADGHDGASSGSPDADRHATTWVRVLRSVGQQVGKYLDEPYGVAQDRIGSMGISTVSS